MRCVRCAKECTADTDSLVLLLHLVLVRKKELETSEMEAQSFRLKDRYSLVCHLLYKHVHASFSFIVTARDVLLSPCQA